MDWLLALLALWCYVATGHAAPSFPGFLSRGNMHLCKNMLSPVETFVLQPSDDYRSAASANVMATCGARPSTYRPMSLAPEDFNQDCLDQAFRKFGYHATTGKLLVKNRHGILLATPGISVSEYTPKPYRRRGENAIRQVQAVNHEQHRVVCILPTIRCSNTRVYRLYMPRNPQGAPNIGATYNPGICGSGGRVVDPSTVRECANDIRQHLEVPVDEVWISVCTRFNLRTQNTVSDCSSTPSLPTICQFNDVAEGEQADSWSSSNKANSQLVHFSALKQNQTRHQWFGWFRPLNYIANYDAVRINCSHEISAGPISKEPYFFEEWFTPIDDEHVGRPFASVWAFESTKMTCSAQVRLFEGTFGEASTNSTVRTVGVTYVTGSPQSTGKNVLLISAFGELSNARFHPQIPSAFPYRSETQAQRDNGTYYLNPNITINTYRDDPGPRFSNPYNSSDYSQTNNASLDLSFTRGLSLLVSIRWEFVPSQANGTTIHLSHWYNFWRNYVIITENNTFHLSLGETRAWPQLCRVFSVYDTKPVDDEVPFDNVAQGPYQVRVNVFQTMLFFQDFPSRLNGSRYSCERQGTWVRDIFDLHWVTVFLKDPPPPPRVIQVVRKTPTSAKLLLEQRTNSAEITHYRITCVYADGSSNYTEDIAHSLNQTVAGKVHRVWVLVTGLRRNVKVDCQAQAASFRALSTPPVAVPTFMLVEEVIRTLHGHSVSVQCSPGHMLLNVATNTSFSAPRYSVGVSAAGRQQLSILNFTEAYRGTVGRCYNPGTRDTEKDFILDFQPCPCLEEGSCRAVKESYLCACLPGFRGNQLVCADIDECQNKTATKCGNATCVNSRGSHHCVCESPQLTLVERNGKFVCLGELCLAGTGIFCAFQKKNGTSLLWLIILGAVLAAMVLLIAVALLVRRRRRQPKDSPILHGMVQSSRTGILTYENGLMQEQEGAQELNNLAYGTVNDLLATSQNGTSAANSSTDLAGYLSGPKAITVHGGKNESLQHASFRNGLMQLMAPVKSTMKQSPSQISTLTVQDDVMIYDSPAELNAWQDIGETNSGGLRKMITSRAKSVGQSFLALADGKDGQAHSVGVAGATSQTSVVSTTLTRGAPYSPFEDVSHGSDPVTSSTAHSLVISSAPIGQASCVAFEKVEGVNALDDWVEDNSDDVEELESRLAVPSSKEIGTAVCVTSALSKNSGGEGNLVIRSQDGVQLPMSVFHLPPDEISLDNLQLVGALDSGFSLVHTATEKTLATVSSATINLADDRTHFFITSEGLPVKASVFGDNIDEAQLATCCVISEDSSNFHLVDHATGTLISSKGCVQAFNHILPSARYSITKDSSGVLSFMAGDGALVPLSVFGVPIEEGSEAGLFVVNPGDGTYALADENTCQVLARIVEITGDSPDTANLSQIDQSQLATSKSQAPFSQVKSYQIEVDRFGNQVFITGDGLPVSLSVFGAESRKPSVLTGCQIREGDGYYSLFNVESGTELARVSHAEALAAIPSTARFSVAKSMDGKMAFKSAGGSLIPVSVFDVDLDESGETSYTVVTSGNGIYTLLDESNSCSVARVVDTNQAPMPKAIRQQMKLNHAIQVKAENIYASAASISDYEMVNPLTAVTSARMADARMAELSSVNPKEPEDPYAMLDSNDIAVNARFAKLVTVPSVKPVGKQQAQVDSHHTSVVARFARLMNKSRNLRALQYQTLQEVKRT